jgi:hypothetical protein
MSQSLILIDILSSAFGEKKRKEKERKKKEIPPFSFFPRLDMTCWLYCTGFSRLLDAIKG